MPGRETERPLDAAAWGARLDGAPTLLQLPADRPPPAFLAGADQTINGPFPSCAAPPAEALAADHGADLYGTVLAGWLAVLGRCTDEEDLVVGCSGVPGQDPSDLFVLRQRVDVRQSFAFLTEQTGKHLREAVDAGPVTVEGLCRALGVEPGAAKHPFFQVRFAQVDESSLGTADPDAGSPPCDVVLRWSPGPERIHVSVEFAPALFDEWRAAALAGQLGALLDGALADADQPLHQLPLLTAEDHQQLGRWNETAYPHDAERSIFELFAEQAVRSPDAVAVEMGGTAVSYAELDRRARRLAERLREHGVGPDVTVAVSIERSIELVLGVLAVLAAGGAYVPVDPAYPVDRRTYMLQASQARLLLVAGDSGVRLPPSWTLPVLRVDADGAGDAAASGAGVGGAEPAPAAGGGARGEHLGYVIFTSGSTGQPKAVALPQRALTNLVEWQLRRPGFAPAARTLQFASLSFDVSFQELLTTWASGGTLVLVPDAVRRDPRGLLDHLVQHDVERIFLPFVALRGLADAAVTSGRIPTRLREVYTAGEQLQVDDTVRAFFAALPDCLLENQYGPSESHVASSYRLQGPPVQWPALPSIGGPIANTTLHVLDATQHLRPVGVPGELYIGGVCLARGYLGRSDLTDERFVRLSLTPDAGPVRLYRTGDVARWSPDGTLEYLGRTDNQVKLRGYRIEPGEVGAVLSGFPGVRQCVARVADVPGVGPRLAAYVVPAAGVDVPVDKLLAFARARLPEYMVPTHVAVLDALPLTSSGKVDLQALPDPTFDRRVLSAPYRAPGTDPERALVAMWDRLLGVDGIGVDDDFFELGGDSLMAVELFAWIRERFDRELPLGALAEAPTVAGLARHVEQPSAQDDAADDDTTDPWRPLVPLRRTGSRPPLFCVHGGHGNVASFPLLARQLDEDQPVYALQWGGLSGRGGARTIQAMAEGYLDEVRRVQPSGPYRFAGQCIGGLIAREMVRSLVAQGEAVDLLVMYDSPNLYSGSFRLRRGTSLPVPAARAVYPVLDRLNTAAELVAGRRSRRRIVRVVARSMARRTVPAGKDREYFGSRVMVRAAWRYPVPPLGAVRTVLIHSGLQDGSTISLPGAWDDGLMGWSGHVGPDFEVHHVPGDHNALPYDPESVRVLREALGS